MPTSPLFQQFVDDELARAADLIARTIAATVEQLRQPRDGLLSSSERQHLFDLQQALQVHAGRFQREFVDALREAVKAEMGGQPAPTGSARASGPGGLQLMDETRVEADIEISRAIQAIDTTADWELRELQTFTSTLRGQEHVSAESNPLRPQVYARALWHATTQVPGLVPVQQAILLRIAATTMAGFLKLAWAAACTRLEDQGVQPGIYRTVVYSSNTGRPQTAPEVDVTRPGALDGLLDAMPGGAASAAQPSGPARTTGAARGRRDPGPALDEALRRVEALLQQLPAQVTNQPLTPAPRLAEHRDALFATTGETIDRQIIELLSRLFETILADPLLQPGFRAVIARLQVSALRIALHDPAMLKTHEHPVWLLMERIAVASAGTSADDARLLNLLRFCENLVDDMQREPVQDADLYRRSLGRLDAFLDQSLRRAQRDAQEAIDALRLSEQIDDMQQQVSARLVEQMVPIRTSAPIRRFVTGPWARVIAQAMLKYGDKSPHAVAFMKAVDELLWSLQLPDHPQSRQRLIALLPGLLQRLREGMALIDMPQGEQQQVLDELMVVHTEALRPGSRTGSATPEAPLSPQDIVQRMRDEVIPAPGEGGSFSDSLIDLSSMDTVPAEWLPATPQSPGDDPHDWVARMAPGQRYRLFLHGHWAQALLLWRSDRGQFFLFVGDSGERHSVTARALERLRGAQLLNTVDAPLLIQRAVDGMLRSLSSSSS
jgi:hypothetical protein